MYLLKDRFRISSQNDGIGEKSGEIRIEQIQLVDQSKLQFCAINIFFMPSF